MEELSKDERILKEKRRLTALFKNIEQKMKKLTVSLIDNAAFMSTSLEELQKIINKKGYTEEYQNGANQKGVKKTSEVELYNTMIKNHMQIMKQLCELLPKDIPQEDDDGFGSFLNDR